MRLSIVASLAVFAFCGLTCATAQGADFRVAVIKDPGGRREGEGAERYFEVMTQVLSKVNLPYSVLTQDDVLRGRLGAYRVAIIPYGPNLSAPALAVIKSFCSNGGKVMCFYRTYGLDGELGLESTSYVASPDRTLFRHVRFRKGALAGLPEGFDQESWNIQAPWPKRGTVVLADWLDVNGQETGRIAATLSDGGLYFSHVLIPEQDEEQRKAGLMLLKAAQYLSERVVRQPSSVAVVFGTLSAATGEGDGRLVGPMVAEMQRILDSVGLRSSIVTDEGVASGALKGKRVAIFPLNFRISDEEAEAVRAFVANGGKVIACFSAEQRLLPLMGVTATKFTRGGQASPFNVVKFVPDKPRGFPDSFAQRSSNIMAATLAPDGRVIATWHDTDGTDTGYPAVVLSPTGMYFSYILYAGDVAKTSQFLLAAIASLTGEEAYKDAVEHIAPRLWEFRRYETADELRRACAGEPRADESFKQAVQLAQKSRSLISAGRFYDAYQAVQQARKAAELAFIRSLPAGPDREFRGTWIHNVAVPNQDWDSFFAGMKRAHLNALLPNVCAAGYAHYKSDLLPTSDFIEQHGPQVEKMIRAAHAHGIEVHLWRVCFNLWRPGRDVVQKLAAEGRVCVDPQGNVIGGPNNGSLCPSNPQNQRLEINAMIEMVQKFHPDGIHFDYIRYPSGNCCYCEGCRRRFEARIGRRVENWPQDVLSGGPLRQQYLQFRRDQVTHVVAEVSRRVRQLDPKVKISAAVFSDWASARDTVGQDWKLWVEKGYLDFVCPMNYTQSPDELAAIVSRQVGWVGRRVPLESGIGAFRSSSAWHTADLVDTARRNGADGLVFFDYRGRVVSEFIPALVEGPLRNEAKTPWAK